MNIESAQEVVRLYFDEALNLGNLSVVDQILAPEFTLYVPPSLGDGARVQGPEGFRQLVVELRRAFCRPPLHRARHHGER